MIITLLKTRRKPNYIITGKIFSLVAMFAFLLSFQTTAQSEIISVSTTPIVLSPEGCIEIPAADEGAIYNRYELERVEAHFADLAQLKKHLGFISNNIITFLLNSDESAIIMHLHKDRVQPEQVNSVASWNNYVQGKCIQL
ncbi:MAG: hypothetical protein ACI837_000755 [Crocinitomicaceae bacterium]|jgi:hypothetical protein